MTTLPHNPFRELRKRLNISQYQLGKEAGVSKHAVLRLEQGAYGDPLPSLIEYFVRAFPSISRAELRDQYTQFQYETRASNAGCLGPNFQLLSPSNNPHSLHPSEAPFTSGTCPIGVHPLSYLRTIHSINPTQLAKLICVSQQTIVYFERRVASQLTVPQQIINALHDADYTEEDTDLLSDAYDRYRSWIKVEKGLKLVSNSPVGSDTHARSAV